MSKRQNRDDFEDSDVWHDDDLDVDEFLTDMGERSHKRRQRAAWQQLEDRVDLRRLREQLEDWDDWDVADLH